MAKTVRYYIDVDESGAVRGGRATEEAFQKVDEAAGKTGVSTIALGNIMADMATKALAHLSGLPGKMFDLASGAQETGSKYKTVFGPAVDEVNEFLDEFATKAGLSVTQFKEITSNVGAVTQGFGFGVEQSKDLSIELVKLAGDLASFNNVPIEETSKAIIAGLAGENEMLKRYGIVVNEAITEKKAFEMTGKSNANQLTQQERALAKFALINEKAGVAVGDLERTQDSAANTQRRVQATLRNIGQELSNEFLPVMAEGLATFEKLLDSDQFDRFMAGNKATISNIVIGIDFLKTNTEIGVEATWAVWEWLKDNMATLFINMVTMAKNYITSIPEIFWNNIQMLFRIYQALEDYNTQTISNIIQGFWELGKAIAAALTDPLNAKERIEAAFSNLLQIGKDQVANFADLGKEIGEEMKQNFEENAALIADGLIEYDHSAFTGVEFVSWSEAAKKRLENSLKVSASVTPEGELDNFTPKAVNLSFEELFGDFEISDLGIDWAAQLRIPDGTIDTLNQNLAAIDLMPESSISQLNEKLNTVKDLYVNAQSDSERARLVEVERSIQMQIQAKEQGIDIERAQMEAWIDEQAELWNHLYSSASDYVHLFSKFRQQEADRQIRRIDKETKTQVTSINKQLEMEHISEAQRSSLIEQRIQLEEQAEIKKTAIKRDAFEKENQAKFVMGVAETAVAVIEALPNVPLSVAVGLLGAAQTALIASQPNPYLDGGPILERLPNGKTSPGMKMFSINENGKPEYIINADSTRQFEPLLDLINYSPNEAEQILKGFGIRPFLKGGQSNMLVDMPSGVVSKPNFAIPDVSASIPQVSLNTMAGREFGELPVIENQIGDLSEVISEAIDAGFASLDVKFKMSGRDLEGTIEGVLKRKARDIFKGLNNA